MQSREVIDLEWEVVNDPHAEEAPSSSAGPSCSRPPARPAPVSEEKLGHGWEEFEDFTPEDMYRDALEQAKELLADSDPRAQGERLTQACEETAWLTVYEEAATRQQLGNLQGKWAEFVGDPSHRKHIEHVRVAMDGELGRPKMEPKATPQVRQGRRRCAGAADEPSLGTFEDRPSTGKGAQGEKPSKPRVPGFHWQRMVERIQARKRWSAKASILNYSKNGLPKNLDGPATGLGKHVGRWAWREIRSNW